MLLEYIIYLHVGKRFDRKLKGENCSRNIRAGHRTLAVQVHANANAKCMDCGGR